MRHSRYVGNQNDAAPYGFATCGGADAVTLQNTPFFCTVRDGAPQENAAVFSKFMQSAAGIMQTDKADSIGLCKGVRFVCTKTGVFLRAVYSV